jgi:hypothetical protein
MTRYDYMTTNPNKHIVNAISCKHVSDYSPPWL